jgi:DNA-binding protein HU-beta
MANKKTLTVAVATELGISQAKAKPIVETIMSTIKTALSKGDSVKIVNFAKFSVVQRKARLGRNPQTGEPLQIEAKKAVKFRSGKALADAVNGVTEAIEIEQDEIDEINEAANEVEEIEESLQDLVDEGQDISEIVEIEDFNEVED